MIKKKENFKIKKETCFLLDIFLYFATLLVGVLIAGMIAVAYVFLSISNNGMPIFKIIFYSGMLIACLTYIMVYWMDKAMQCIFARGLQNSQNVNKKGK